MRHAALHFLISTLFAAVGILLIFFILTPFLTTSLESSRIDRVLGTIEHEILRVSADIQQGEGMTGTLPLPKDYTTLITDTDHRSCTDVPEPDDTGILILIHRRSGQHNTLLAYRLIPLSRLSQENPLIQRVNVDCLSLTKPTALRVTLTNGILALHKK